MSKITIDDLTKNEIEGTGIFDELMRSVKAHLIVEYDAKRITDVNYSSVYLGALQSTMSQAVEFLLKKDAVYENNELTKAKNANLVLEGELLTLKKQELQYDIYNAKYKECLLQNQIKKIQAETQKTLQDTANAKTQASILRKQQSKLDAEIKLYLQKTETEKAQIHDKIDSVHVSGTIGKQNEMYRNQANGYLRLAEQQNARLMLDAYSILQSNGGIENFGKTATMDRWGVTPTNVKKAVDNLADGIKDQNNEHAVKGEFDTNVVTEGLGYKTDKPVEPLEVTPAECEAIKRTFPIPEED